jgi:Ser/Thr protein kinase RdoA (MazF antagonist)
VVLGSLVAAYEAVASLPPADLVATWGLVAMAMVELLLWTTQVLRSSAPDGFPGPADAAATTG